MLNKADVAIFADILLNPNDSTLCIKYALKNHSSGRETRSIVYKMKFNLSGLATSINDTDPINTNQIIH